MIYILFHHPCKDGFGAAYSAWKKFGDSAKYIGVNYGKPLPELPDATEVFIVDFSYDKEILEELNKKCKLTVLDHHKTAQEQLQGLSYAQFDMNRSGAGMAWDFFHPNSPRPWLINYIEDRDLWRFSLPNCHEIIAGLFSYPEDFSLWDKFQQADLLNEGRAIKRYANILLNDMSRNTQVLDFLEFKNVPICNASSSLISDLGQTLSTIYPQAPFYAIYYDTKEGKRKWSLRSSDNQEDVSVIANRFKGGGHRNAAGFIEEFPYQHIALKKDKNE